MSQFKLVFRKKDGFKVTRPYTLRELLEGRHIRLIFDMAQEGYYYQFELQYIGLVDKNKSKLFEGDICRYRMDDCWKYGVIRKVIGGYALYVFRIGNRYYSYPLVFEFQNFLATPSKGNKMLYSFERLGNYFTDGALIEKLTNECEKKLEG